MTIRRVAVVLCVALSLVVLRADERVTHPYAGVTYVDRTADAPRRVHMHVVQIDLDAPGLRFKVTPPSGSRETIRETTLEFLTREHAQIAINAHFFLPFPSDDRDAWLVGLAASEGRVYSAFETPEQRYAIVADSPALNIDATNHATIVHRGDATALWNTVSGSAQIVTDGVKTIPDLEWYTRITARTAIGLSRDSRTLTLFTVDVRGDSDGMRIGEVADVLMRDFAVWNALNLDGGGSTSIAMEDPETHVATLLNASSDNNPLGRSVGSSLAIFARRP